MKKKKKVTANDLMPRFHWTQKCCPKWKIHLSWPLKRSVDLGIAYCGNFKLEISDFLACIPIEHLIVVILVYFSTSHHFSFGSYSRTKIAKIDFENFAKSKFRLSRFSTNNNFGLWLFLNESKYVILFPNVQIIAI